MQPESAGSGPRCQWVGEGRTIGLRRRLVGAAAAVGASRRADQRRHDAAVIRDIEPARMAGVRLNGAFRRGELGRAVRLDRVGIGGAQGEHAQLGLPECNGLRRHGDRIFAPDLGRQESVRHRSKLDVDQVLFIIHGDADRVRVLREPDLGEHRSCARLARRLQLAQVLSIEVQLLRHGQRGGVGHRLHLDTLIVKRGAVDGEPGNSEQHRQGQGEGNADVTVAISEKFAHVLKIAPRGRSIHVSQSH